MVIGEREEWTLNGTKAWITKGVIADIHVVLGVVDPDLGSKGHASFVVVELPAAKGQSSIESSNPSLSPSAAETGGNQSNTDETIKNAKKREVRRLGFTIRTQSLSV